MAGLFGVDQQILTWLRKSRLIKMESVLTRYRILPRYWPCHTHPRIIFMTGMPRSGSTLAKRFLGKHPSIVIAPPGTYTEGWSFAISIAKDKIVVFKNTRNMPILRKIYSKYGNRAWFLGIVRDPRDELVSLLETDIHEEIPRDETFWNLWYQRYLTFLDFAVEYQRKGTKIGILRYEDLVMNPIKTKRAFLNWLELPCFDLSREYEPIHEMALKGKGEDWKTHRQNRVHTASIGRWCQETAGDKLRTILFYKQHQGAERLMEMFGYGESLTDPQLEWGSLSFLR
jgi:hypothetical protein